MRVIGGKYKGRKLYPPAGMKARPTTDLAREGLFNILANIATIEHSNVLDLFCGTGGISLEFISRGAQKVIAVDVETKSKLFIEGICREWEIKNLRVVKADIFKLVNKANEQFEIVFADPPYADPRFAQLPDMILSSGWVKPGGILILEHGESNNYESHPSLEMHRAYGGVNFSFFRKDE